MDDRLYQVRVTALATDRVSPSRIHADFAELFCLSPPEAEARLSLLPLVVRRGLAPDLAAKYVRVLGRAGLHCEMLPDEAAAAEPAPDRGAADAQGLGQGQALAAAAEAACTPVLAGAAADAGKGRGVGQGWPAGTGEPGGRPAGAGMAAPEAP